MNARELSKLSNAELHGKLDDAYRELFNLRFQRAQGKLTDTNAITKARHNIARIKTVLRQRQLAAEITQSTQQTQN
ncbi:MAG: 50S ribosomal protein L29 [Thermoflexales bacterium]